MIEVNHSKIKETNRKKIIKLLLEKDEITKLDISRELDISITTVSTNISELKKIGIVEDVRSLESTGGRKAMAIKLNENCHMAEYCTIFFMTICKSKHSPKICFNFIKVRI